MPSTGSDASAATSCRAIHEAGRKDIEVVAINDLGPVETNAHLLRFDSIHGRFNAKVEVDGEFIVVDGQRIKVTAVRNPAELPHRELGVDIALECTGIFTSKDKAKAHLDAGAKRVIVSAPADGADLTVVYGVNHDKLTADHLVISKPPAPPTARAGGEGAQRSRRDRARLHDDDPFLHQRSALPRPDAQGPVPARAAALSMIPTSTGAAKAVGLVLPELKGKLDGTSIRVPTPNVSAVDLVFTAKRQTSVEEINNAIRAAADGPLKGVLAYTDQPNVSIDFNHDPHSSRSTSTRPR